MKSILIYKTKTYSLASKLVVTTPTLPEYRGLKPVFFGDQLLISCNSLQRCPLHDQPEHIKLKY